MSSPGTNNSAVTAVMDAGQKRAFAAGSAGLIAFLIVGFAMHSSTGSWLPLLHQYLIAFVLWTAVTVGCLGVLMIHHMTGGWWGYPMRRIFEAGARNVMVIAVFFLPILFA